MLVPVIFLVSTSCNYRAFLVWRWIGQPSEDNPALAESNGTTGWDACYMFAEFTTSKIASA